MECCEVESSSGKESWDGIAEFESGNRFKLFQATVEVIVGAKKQNKQVL